MSGENLKTPMDNKQSFQGVNIVTEPYHPSSSLHPNSSLPVTGHTVIQRGSSDLPCFGIGIGWLLFILGFILGVIPWYVGVCLLLCANYDHREKTGLIACVVLVLAL
ncbi:60S ribosomal protein L18a-like protein [Linum perenne]